MKSLYMYVCIAPNVRVQTKKSDEILCTTLNSETLFL